MSRMIFRTGDPIADFAAWDFENAMELERYPKCDYCGEPITEYVYTINHETLCAECVKSLYAEDAEEVIERVRDEGQNH